MDSPPTVLGLGFIDDQRVAAPLNLQSRVLPHLLSIFQPFHSWSQPRGHMAWNQNVRVQPVLSLGDSDLNTDLMHSRWCSSDWSTVVPALRSHRPINAGSLGGCWTMRCIWSSYHISHELLLSRCRVHGAIHLSIKHDLKSKQFHLPQTNHLHSDCVGCRSC